MQKTFKTDLCKLSDGDKNVFKSIVYIAAIDTGSTISSATHTIITSLLTNTIFNKIKSAYNIINMVPDYNWSDRNSPI